MCRKAVITCPVPSGPVACPIRFNPPHVGVGYTILDPTKSLGTRSPWLGRGSITLFELELEVQDITSMTWGFG